MRIAAAPWQPDAPAYESTGLPFVRNAIADRGFYRPVRGLSQLTSTGMPADPRGMFCFRRAGIDWLNMIAAGADIYRIQDATTAPINVSRGGGPYLMQPLDRWRGLQFGHTAILTNFRDRVQAYDTRSLGQFYDLGYDISDSDPLWPPPRAKYIANVRGRVVLAYTADDVDGEMPNRIWWHGFTGGLPDLDAWEPSLATGADFNQIVDIGNITGMTGGEFGTVLCEDGIARMTTGGPAIYQIENVSGEIGCNLPESVIRYGAVTYFWSRQGWMAFNGGEVRPIGAGKIDRWFANDMDFDAAHRMWPAPVDEGNGSIGWLYCGAGHAGMPNRMLIYASTIGEWTVADISAEIVGPFMTFGGDLDDVADMRWLDMDAFDGDLDDPALWSRHLRTVAVRDGFLMAQIGGPLPGIFQSREFEMTPGRRSTLRLVTVNREQGASSTEIGWRDQMSKGASWTSGFPEQGDGRVRCREKGRYHSLRTTLTDWRTFSGWDVEGVGAGLR